MTNYPPGMTREDWKHEEIMECTDTGKMPIEWYQSQVRQLCAALQLRKLGEAEEKC